MNEFDNTLRNLLISIIDNYTMQKSTPKYIKKNYNNLYNWIIEQTKKYNPKNLTESIYIIINGPHKNCKHSTIKPKFKTYELGYSQFCSSNCYCKRLQHSKLIKEIESKRTVEERKAIIEKKEQTNLAKYGTKNTSDLEETKNKVKETNLKKFGVNYPLQSEEIKEKTKKTCLENYGVDNPFKSEEIKSKIKETNLLNLGVEFPMQNNVVKEKTKKTCLELYGVENVSQINEVKQKVLNTNLERYCINYVFLSEWAIKKNYESKISKFGHISPFTSKEVNNKSKETNLEKYGNIYYQRSHIPQNILDILDDKSKFEEMVSNKTLTDIITELSVSLRTVLNYLNKYDLRSVVKYNNVSSYETKVKEFLERNNIKYIHNSRTIIKPLQLDFYLPDHNLAIEVGSYFYHCEQSGEKHPLYHYNKWLECRNKNIILLQFFDETILHKFDKIEEKIKSVINNTEYNFEELTFNKNTIITNNQYHSDLICINNNYKIESILEPEFFYTKNYLELVEPKDWQTIEKYDIFWNAGYTKWIKNIG
jgi:hypothetical protein